MAQALVHVAVATVKGGFWEQYGTTLTGQTGAGSLRHRAAQLLSRTGTRALREVMTELDGVAAGATALKVEARIVAAEELGGVRAIESVELVNAATLAADSTRIEADINTFSSTIGSSPPANLDGNPLGTR